MDHHTGKIETTWKDLAKKFGYTSGEAIRSVFKRERTKLGIIKTESKPYCGKYPRIIVFDLEVTPMLVYTFDLRDNFISPDHVAVDGNLICWSAKELNDSEMHNDVLTMSEAKSQDDKRITASLWKYLNGADILIGHNIKSYDIKYMNSRFIYYGLAPISSYQSIDTLLEARKYFRFTSNKLSFINKSLGITEKLSNDGMDLWIRCMKGFPKALRDMQEYCDGDILATEELYYRLRPYITGHPNLGLYIETEDPVCPNCGSAQLIDNGSYYTNANVYNSLRCGRCGALSRERLASTPPETKKRLLRN